MAKYYDKDQLKEQLEISQIFDLVELWGGEPEYTEKGLIAQTICHNLPGTGSRKLYYYNNTKLFKCFSGCVDSTFDIFELCIKVAEIQKNEDWQLYDAMVYIADYFGILGQKMQDSSQAELEDYWEIFKKHNISINDQKKDIILPEYDKSILNRFAYPRILSWEQEGISKEVIKQNIIGYFPGQPQITIPHFDIHNRLIGIRGRNLSATEAERYGKYRPLCIGKNQVFNHPLSMNLYNLNNSQDNIKQAKIAIIFEGEKSALLYQTYYGRDNDISVACCGSAISSYHIQLLQDLGVTEIIIAFDRQFQEIGDHEFQLLKSKLIHIYKKYHTVIKISAIFDKNMITGYKSAPIDEGREKFEKLLKERIIPYG